jgi:hypothetical protein
MQRKKRGECHPQLGLREAGRVRINQWGAIISGRVQRQRESWFPTFEKNVRAGHPPTQFSGESSKIPGGKGRWNPMLAQKTRKNGGTRGAPPGLLVNDSRASYSF